MPTRKDEPISTTEQGNERSAELDACSALEIVRLMNSEDALIAAAVGQEAEKIATAIDVIADRFIRGGRLFYLGAGTSGRLGVLDASECPPTFSTDPSMVVGIIAGGQRALTTAIEGAEDDPHQAQLDLQRHNFGKVDVLVGIASSGRTPFVRGGLGYARGLGAYTIGIACNPQSAMHHDAELMIVPIVGPEILSGSTRLKAGTATKMVLNMLTTGAMVRIGKTFGNLMVDLKATNVKLKERSVRIVAQVAEVTLERARELLEQCDFEVKTAIVAELCGMSALAARTTLENSAGQLRGALAQRTDTKGS